MTARVLRHADRVPTPWANGGGLTREVARAGTGGTGGTAGASDRRGERAGPGFDWRISVADVDRPGPFSGLPGVDRVIVLLDGTGLVLSVDGREQVLEGLVPFAFSGDAATSCELRNGPTRDFNVMTARGRVSALVEVLPVSGRRELSADGEGEELVVLAATDGLVATEPPAAAVLARLDALAGPAVAVEGEGTVIVVRLRPLPN